MVNGEWSERPLAAHHPPPTTNHSHSPRGTAMSNHRDNADPHGPDRRDFLQTAGLVGAALSLSEALLRAEAPPQLRLSNTGPDRIPRKPFGRTTETVSV